MSDLTPYDQSEEEELAKAIALSLSGEDGQKALSASTQEFAPCLCIGQMSAKSNGGMHPKSEEELPIYDEEDDAELARAIELSLTTQSADDTEVPEGDVLHLLWEVLQESAKADNAAWDSNSELDNRIALIESGHADDSYFMAETAEFLLYRFRRLGNLADVERAISIQYQCLDLTPDSHPNKPVHFHNLSAMLHERFERVGDLNDLDQAISALGAALDLTPGRHPDRCMSLNGLGILLMRHFKVIGDLTKLNQAISVQRQALDIIPSGHPSMPGILNGLSNSLDSRFQRIEDLEDLDQAISLQRRAIGLTPDGHPEKPARIGNFGIMLGHRFGQTGNIADLDMAISIKQKAVDSTPSDHPDLPTYFNNLGSSLQARFEKLGDLADLDHAIAVQAKAVNQTPDGHPDKPGCLNNLGNSLGCRFQRTGDLPDLDHAISVQRKAVNLTPDSHHDKPMRLSNLGNSLMRRFEQIGELFDLNQAISVQHKAVDLISNDHPCMPACLSNLGNTLHCRFERMGGLADLNGAISVKEKAIELTPNSHPDKPMWLNNLGHSLQHRFEQVGDPIDIEQAILLLQESIKLTPDGHPRISACLTNLGNALQSCFERLGDVTILSKAISVRRKAVDLTPDGHPDKPVWLNNLGVSLTLRFKRLDDLADIHAAIDSFRRSATSITGKPTVRFNAARCWAKLSLELEAPSGQDSSLDAYGVMISLIPLVVWLGRTIRQRYQDMDSLGTAINEAAAVACKLSRYDLAIEWLEQGRSIVWGQILHLRTPVDALHDVNPELASQLHLVACELETAGSSALIANVDTGAQGSLEEAALAHRQLAFRWESLLKQARSIAGFEDFLLHKKLLQLGSVAQSGAVVLINVDSVGCDALILSPQSKDVQHISLEVTLGSLQSAQNTLRAFLSQAGVRQRGTFSACNCSGSKVVITNILTALWRNIVKPVLYTLGYLAPLPGNSLPHITWCLTGPLAFLPLHAAGDYSGDIKSRAFNYVVSSYTPSLTALLETTQDAKIRMESVLAVTQTNAENYSSLPGALEEATKLKSLLSGRAFQQLDDEQATITAVSQAMDMNAVIHLACHAVQNRGEPTKSGFLLYDGILELGSIMKKRLAKAQLAYLSACQTAAGEERLPDEAVHLAAGMLIAGYPSVIATMWSIRDKDAPLVAEAFYRRALSGEEAKTAEALHWAVAELRNTVGEDDFLSWAPFIHVGH